MLKPHEVPYKGWQKIASGSLPEGFDVDDP
jgi:hypothetical protein